MENRAHAFAAGVFVLVCMVLFAGIVWWFSDSREPVKHYTLVTQGSVAGLNVQAQVRYRGMQAGKVSAIQVDDKDLRNILVEIAVRSDLPVTEGTHARLSYQGVTGRAYITLDDKGNNLNALPPETTQRIPLTGGVIERITDSALETLDKLRGMSQRIDMLRDTENMNKINQFLTHAEQASKGAERVTAEAVATLTAAKQAINDANLARLSHTITGWGRAADQATPLIQEARQLVANLDSTAKKLSEGVVSVSGESMPRFNKLVAELTTSSRRFNRLVEDMNSSPQMMLFGREPIDPGPGEQGYMPTPANAR